MKPKLQAIKDQITAIQESAVQQTSRLMADYLLEEHGISIGAVLIGEDGELFTVEKVTVLGSGETPIYGTKTIRYHRLCRKDIESGYWKLASEPPELAKADPLIQYRNPIYTMAKVSASLGEEQNDRD